MFLMILHLMVYGILQNLTSYLEIRIMEAVNLSLCFYYSVANRLKSRSFMIRSITHFALLYDKNQSRTSLFIFPLY